jgi:hypothetical protein
MFIPVEFSELIDIVPYSFVAGMEDVRAILVYVYASLGIILSVAVAADMISFLDEQNFQS